MGLMMAAPLSGLVLTPMATAAAPSPTPSATVTDHAGAIVRVNPTLHASPVSHNSPQVGAAADRDITPAPPENTHGSESHEHSTNTPLPSGTVIATRPIPHTTVTLPDATLPAGVTVTTVHGHDGVLSRMRSYEPYVDASGHSTQVPVTSSVITTPPQDTIVVKGTNATVIQGISTQTITHMRQQAAADAKKRADAAKKAQAAQAQQDADQEAQAQSVTSLPDRSDSSSRPPVVSSYHPTDGTTCRASFYDEPQTTASGEQFDPSAMTAASKTLPLGSSIRVTNPSTHQSVVVRINDRGPYVSGRCLDLSAAAFDAIGDTGAGVMTVTYEPA